MTGWAGLMTVVCLTSRLAAVQAAEQPNVVILLVDDLGWADLACYGGDLHETPHIDRFVKQSVKFTDAYAAAPVCSPTRASILTGKYPARLREKLGDWLEKVDAQMPRPNRARRGVGKK